MPAAIPIIAAVGGAVVTGLMNKQNQNSADDAAAAANARGTVPDYARPYVTDAMERAKTLADRPYEAYGKPLVAGQNPYEAQAQGALQSWAGGTPQSAMAASVYGRMAGGENPFAQQAAQAGIAQTHARGMGDAAQSQFQGMTPGHADYAGASNDYIGAKSQGISGAPTVSGSVAANPYIGQQTGAIAGAGPVAAGRNAMLGMDNPYLNSAIDYAQGDVNRAYDRSVRPQEDQAMAASGSFGNTGLMSQQSEDRRNLAGELGRVSSGMRMQDYSAQQGLQEADVNRRYGADTFNAGNNQRTQEFNANNRSGDLSRNLAAAFQQQGVGLDAAKFDASNAFGAQQFNSQLGAADLGRNAQLAQGMGQFNSTGQNANSIWNAGQNSAASQFGADAYNRNSLSNTGILNNAKQFDAGAYNRGDEFNAGARTQGNQYNTSALNNMGQFNGTMGSQQQYQGLQGLMGLDSRGLQAGQALGQLGQTQRAIDQQGVQSGYDQWLRAQNYPQQQQGNYQDSVRQLTYGSAPIVPQQQGSTLSGAVGGGLAAYAAFKPSSQAPTGGYLSGQGATGGGPPGTIYDGYAYVPAGGYQ